MKDIVEEIKQKIDIVDIISKKVSLKKKSGRFLGLCPFHDEKTPSFSVDPKRQYYYCFGCQRSGDVFSFMQDYNHLTFSEAKEELAKIAGITLKKNYQTQSLEQQQRKKDNYQLLDLLSKFCQNSLKTCNTAISYLEERGITAKSIKDFEIGYLSSFGHLDFCRQSKINPDNLIDIGVLIKNDNDSYYSRFKQRIIFPIKDLKQRVIGFGGRTLDDAIQPKYLNSPETELFKKNKNVYNLVNYDRNLANIIVCEGYLDVISLSQAGFRNTVATMGTALGQDQIRLLFKYNDNPIICFDGDKAGIKASIRVFEEALPIVTTQKYLKFAKLPSGYDPDDYIKTNGSEDFSHLIDKASTFSEFLFNNVLDNSNLNIAEKRANYYRQAKDYIRIINDNDLKQALLDQLSSPAYWPKKTRYNRTIDTNLYRKLDETNNKIFLLALVSYPSLIDKFFDDITNIEIKGAASEQLTEIIANYLETKPLDKNTNLDYNSNLENESKYKRLFSQSIIELAPFKTSRDIGSASQYLQTFLSSLQENKITKELTKQLKSLTKTSDIEQSSKIINKIKLIKKDKNSRSL